MIKLDIVFQLHSGNGHVFLMHSGSAFPNALYPEKYARNAPGMHFPQGFALGMHCKCSFPRDTG